MHAEKIHHQKARNYTQNEPSKISRLDKSFGKDKKRHIKNFIYLFFKKVANIFFLFSFSLIVTFGIIEIVLRIVQSYNWSELLTRIDNPVSSWVSNCNEFDEKVIYRMISNKKKPECITLDELGFRASGQKMNPAGVNIVFIGDSFTWGGVGVKDDETYPYLTQDFLNRRGFLVNAYNGGVPGYGVDQELIYLKEFILPKIKTDVVVWNYFENDDEDSDFFCLLSVQNNVLVPYEGRFNTLYIKGKLLPILPTYVLNLKLFDIFNSIIPERWTPGCTQGNLLTTNYQQQKTKLLFSKLQELSLKYKFKIVVSFIEGQRGYLPSGLQNAKYKLSSATRLKNLSQVNLTILNISQEVKQRIATGYYSKLLYLPYKSDILKAISQDISQSLFVTSELFPEGYKHPNKFGNALIAQLVAEKLEPIVTSLQIK